jgi:hypothetical protein
MKNILILLSLVLLSCQPYPHLFKIENGDIIFIGESDGNLSKAITEVTQTDLKTQYSHIGIIEKEGKNYWVLHAAPENGSERISLDEFLEKERKNSKIIDVYRIQPHYQPNFKEAISMAKSMLGKPYNFTYSLSDTAYYCSDFVYHSFEKSSIFEMNPMTFKNPGEEEFNSGWIEFYRKLGREIPEGEMGCNPNGMASSEKLIKVGTL